MAGRYSDKLLRRMRNELPLRRVLEELHWPHKLRDGRRVFLCPKCREYRASLHPQENLGRCFVCRINFNPIDLTMAIRETDFVDAVEFLMPLLPPESCTDPPRPHA